jgi:hypothetical protein
LKIVVRIEHGSNQCCRLLRIDPPRSVASVKSVLYFGQPGHNMGRTDAMDFGRIDLF